MKKSTLAVCSSFFLLFSSCASIRIPVPGEGELKRASIYTEYMSIADAYNDLGKYDKACQYYELAKKNKKLYWTSSYKLARCYTLNKKYDKALTIFQELLKRDENNTSLKMSVAYLYAMNGNISEAKVLYQSLWSENPDNADVLVNYLNVLFASKEYDEFEKYLTELKEKFSDNKSITEFEKKLTEYKKSLEKAEEANSKNKE